MEISIDYFIFVQLYHIVPRSHFNSTRQNIWILTDLFCSVGKKIKKYTAQNWCVRNNRTHLLAYRLKIETKLCSRFILCIHTLDSTTQFGKYDGRYISIRSMFSVCCLIFVGKIGSQCAIKNVERISLNSESINARFSK